MLILQQKVSVKVTRSRRSENGIVVQGAFKARTPMQSRAMRFERDILRLKKLCFPMDFGVETLRKIPTFS